MNTMHLILLIYNAFFDTRKVFNEKILTPHEMDL